MVIDCDVVSDCVSWEERAISVRGGCFVRTPMWVLVNFCRMRDVVEG